MNWVIFVFLSIHASAEVRVLDASTVCSPANQQVCQKAENLTKAYCELNTAAARKGGLEQNVSGQILATDSMIKSREAAVEAIQLNGIAQSNDSLTSESSTLAGLYGNVAANCQKLVSYATMTCAERGCACQGCESFKAQMVQWQDKQKAMFSFVDRALATSVSSTLDQFNQDPVVVKDPNAPVRGRDCFSFKECELMYQRRSENVENF